LESLDYSQRIEIAIVETEKELAEQEA